MTTTTGTGFTGELAADSARSWDPRATERPAVPAELTVDPTLPVTQRLRALRRRHALRARQANDYFATSRSPKVGLPVADERAVRSFLREVLGGRFGLLAVVVVLNALAAIAGILVPRLLGDIVDTVSAAVSAGSQATLSEQVRSPLTWVAIVIAAQAILTFAALSASTELGQGVLARARESVVRSVLRLPLGTVESSGTGDLVTRVTRDVGSMSESVRWALPQVIIASVTVVLTVAGMVANSWLLALPSLLLGAVAVWRVRHYLRLAPAAYIYEGSTYSTINTTLTETVEGARTIEALRLGRRRWERQQEATAVSAQAERYGMTLRNILFAVMDVAFSAPRVFTLAIGAWAYTRGLVSLGQITAAMLYVDALGGPFDMLVHTLDRLQVGLASTSRLVGIATVPPDRVAGDARPGAADLAGTDLRYAYRTGHDVLHGIDLTLAPGERLAVVGPSGSGKSTLGRLLAGIHEPRTGSVTVDDVALVALPLEVLRQEVALVTQEHHVFVGTLRDNVVLAREGSGDNAVRAALTTVGADWVDRLPDGLDTMVGSGKLALTPGQAQQVALARLILADPHTLVLDEATSLIDPRTARTVEGSMNALLSGRAVVAIAHRLHTAHDADRIAVVIDGRIAEIGSHDELMAADGEYAALWRAWTS